MIVAAGKLLEDGTVEYYDWLPEEKCPNWTAREIKKNEIVLETDFPQPNDNAQFYYDKIKPILMEKKLFFKAWFTGSKSIHVHILFKQDLTPIEKEAWVKENFSQIYSDLDSAMFTKERQLILGEEKLNLKNNKPKTLLEEIGKGTNLFELKEEISEEKKEKPKIEKTASEILADTEPTEQERVACIMKIFESGKKTENDIMNFLDLKNKWLNYDAQLTRKKVKGILKNYAKKENPFDKAVKEVPSLDLVDFSEYKKLFNNTDSHLPAFELIKNELGLIGDKYYPAIKAVNYYVESLRQPTISFPVGSEWFDNRIHMILIGGAGTGKGKTKSVIRKHLQSVECSGSRTNLEQLIGKMKIVKGQQEEKKGYFGFKALVIDESQTLVCEEDKHLGAIMRELRLAMDIFGQNKSDKKLVDTDLLSYCPETRFSLMVHDMIFPPIFFDTGTFRRLFAFEFAQSQIKEFDTIANLYKINREKDLANYVNSDSLFNSDTVIFSKEAIEEIVEWFLMWNKFIFLNPNQRVRAISKGLVFSAKTYFFRLSSILSIIKMETNISEKTVRLACMDTIHFLLNTIEIYANKSSPTLSRDIWKSDEINDCMFFEWLYYNKAVSSEKTEIGISEAQEKIGEYYGLMDRQARQIYHKLKKNGYIKDSKGQHDSKVWLGFTPNLDCPIDFENASFPDLKAFVEEKKQNLFESG